jgi:hypothetical protein
VGGSGEWKRGLYLQVSVEDVGRVHVLERTEDLRRGVEEGGRERRRFKIHPPLVCGRRNGGDVEEKAEPGGREGGRAGRREGGGGYLVDEVLDVVDGEGLPRVDDPVQVGLHQIRDDVHVLEGGQGGRGGDVQDADDLQEGGSEGGREGGRESN